MKNLNGGEFAILLFVLMYSSLFFFWVAQTGVNKIISYTPTAKKWSLCMSAHFDEFYMASTTGPFEKVLKECGNSPYFSVIPN